MSHCSHRRPSSSSSYSSPAPNARSKSHSSTAVQDDCTMTSKEFESILTAQSQPLENTPRRTPMIKSRARVDIASIPTEQTDAQLQQSRLIIKVLGAWVASSLGVILEAPLCPYTEALEKRYSSVLEHSACVSRFAITHRDCENLWNAYSNKCYATTASPVARLGHLRYYTPMPRSVGLPLDTWIAWTVPRSSRIAFASKALIEAIFFAKIRDASRKEWRFFDFVEFVSVFGTQNHEAMAQYLVEAFIGDLATQVRKESMRRFKCLLYLLSLPADDPSYSTRDWKAFNEVGPSLFPELTDYLTKIEMSSPSSISAARLKSGMLETIGKRFSITNYAGYFPRFDLYLYYEQYCIL
jgi:hypothetical protein